MSSDDYQTDTCLMNLFRGWLDPCPYKGKIGKEATMAWAENKSKRPDA